MPSTKPGAAIDQAITVTYRVEQATGQNLPAPDGAHHYLGLYRTFDHIDDLILITDRRGRLHYANHAAYQLLGYIRPQLSGMMLFNLCRKEDIARYLQAFQSLQQQGSLQGEFLLCCQDGSQKQLKIHGHTLPDRRCIFAGKDISAGKRAEQALSTSEQRYRSIVESTADGILVSEIGSGRFLFANQAMCQLLDYTREQLVQLSLRQIHPAAELSHILRTLRQMNQGKLSIASDIPVIRRDGSLFYADIKCTALRFDQFDCRMAIIRDVSERREAGLLLKQHLDIQSLLGSLSTDLANAPIETLWQRLPALLARVGQMLGTHCGYMIQQDEGRMSARIHHIWRQNSTGSLPENSHFSLTDKVATWLIQQLDSNGYLALNINDELPPEAASLKALMRLNHSQSVLLAPLYRQQQVFALIGMDSQQEGRKWLWLEGRMLQSVATMLSGYMEQYQRTLELQESQRRLLEAQKLAHVGSWEWDILHDHMHWSDEIYNIVGLSPQSQPSDYNNFIMLAHPQDRALLRESINRALERLSPLALEHRILLPDGSERIVSQQAIVRVSEEGRALRMTGTLQDISESKQKERLLRQSATVYENTLEGVLITDPQLTILDVNPAFTQITGYSREETLGKRPDLLHSGRHDNQFYQQIFLSIRETGHWQGEIWNRRKNGEIFPEWLTISAVYDEQRRVINYVGVFSDISQIKKSESRLEQLAHYDALTRLPNRLLFQSRLEHAIQTARRESQSVAILFIDLDNFKQVNDTLGHGCGDQLLLEVAHRLQACVRQTDTVARIGGDEFLVLLENQHSDNAVIDVASKLVQSCGAPLLINGHELLISASIGISIYPRDGEDGEALMRNADTAMYQSKNEGKACFHFYTEELTRRAIHRVQMEQELRMALARHQLYPVFQPKYHLESGRLAGAEVLLRWHHPQGGQISPEVFIPLAEETGQIIPIGNWTLQQTCQILREWLNEGLSPGVISINIAGPQIRRAPLQETLQDILQQYAIPPHLIDLEVTESFIMHRTDESLSILNRLRDLGVSLSIDDFGTGYSSLSQLKQLPVNTLKIDKSFVRGLPDNEDDCAICQAIISLARTMRMQLIAEGIENEAQRQYLINAGCEYGQGFFYARPMRSVEFADLLRQHCCD